MSRSTKLNELYENYHPSNMEVRPEHLEPLLAEVFKTAQRYFYDDDAAQEFTIEIWRESENLEIKRSFAAYLHRRLVCDRLDMYRRQARQVEQQPPEMLDADGRPYSDEEVLDLLQYRNPIHTQNPAPDIDDLMESITDPLIRRTAELLRQKRSLRQCAEVLEIPPATLRKRLERYRKRNIDKLAA